MIFVKANPGMKLKHPSLHGSQTHLPESGGYWPDDAFTHRRVRDGGVVIADPNEAAPARREERLETAPSAIEQPRREIADAITTAGAGPTSGKSSAGPAKAS